MLKVTDLRTIPGQCVHASARRVTCTAKFRRSHVSCWKKKLVSGTVREATRVEINCRDRISTKATWGRPDGRILFTLHIASTKAVDEPETALMPSKDIKPGEK